MGTAGDQRDEISWVVLELTRQGELRAEEGTLGEAILDGLNADISHPVFVPSTTYFRDGQRHTVHLMEGYAFVATGLPEGCYYELARENPYVRQVLSNNNSSGIPALQVIGNAHVAELRKQLSAAVSQDIDEGMQVHITQGRYRGLTGDVVGMEGNEAFVYIQLRSFQVIRTVPKVFLDPAGEIES
jgi:hypothetical protein